HNVPMGAAIDFILHLDKHLFELTASYGGWVYGLLFAIVFAETGLVVTPFLPGDSLLFAAGALCGAGLLDPVIMGSLLIIAAIVGDAVNYSIGRSIGPRVFVATDSSTWVQRALKREHLDRAHAFFEKHGGKAIVLARFVPIVRTFVPFVAGAASMSYPAFAFYNVTGAILWVVSCFGLGYAFGNVPVIKENFWAVALVIIAVSLIPIVLELVRARSGRATPPVVLP
ncbi:MAG TPA: DedA family protein, partial [Vicinamibacterales bacterium]|nr:DedA family protein [Vicinamibacterales bacterium]